MRAILFGVMLALTACGGGTGSVIFTAYGEEFIEDKIPAEVGTEAGFTDGWELRFTKFVVNLGEIEVGDTKGTKVASMAKPKVFDVAKAGPVEVTRFANLPAGRWDVVGYSIAPVTDSDTGNADAADVTAMKTGGLSVLVAGSATKTGTTKTFEWGFTTNTHYGECEQEQLGKGVVVPVGGEDTAQLTIHGDHLWFDSLQSDEAKMRFDPIAAADTNPADGNVTLAELGAVMLTSLPVTQYGTGGASNVKTLRDFIEVLTRNLGHYRGEGHCNAMSR
ncbi:MAG: hypothetical protein JNK82_13275 [Myxococcaceae bacterium]|nr:hypothetical protein [Myxococcaceae bacterium]